MSFERFMSSDVYVFEHVSGWIECCACSLDSKEETDPWSFQAATPREMIVHLKRHEKAGDDTGEAILNILKDYSDLDIRIQPYIMQDYGDLDI